MSRTEADWVAWTREHRVAYEVSPLLEIAAAAKGPVRIHAQPLRRGSDGQGRRRGAPGGGPTALGGAAGPRGSRGPGGERTARVELDPPHTALLRPENEFKPEVGLTWRMVPPT